MSNATAGYKDTIEISTDDVAYSNLGGLTNPSFPGSRGTIDASAAGEDFVDKIAGRFDNSVSYTCHELPADTAQLALLAAYDAGTEVWARLMRNGVAKRKCKFLVEQASFTSDLDGTEQIEFSLASTGKPVAA